MSTSVRPEPDPKARIRRNVEKMAAQGASEAEIEAYLQHEGLKAQDATATSPAVPRESLRLDVRQPAESTFGLPYDPERGGDFEAAAPSLAALPLVAAQAVPGMEAFQAAAGMAGSRLPQPVKKFLDMDEGNPLSFGESRDALRSVTDPIPAPIKLAAQGPALAKSAAALALSPAKAGAVIGAADQALSADDMTIESRLARAGMAGAAGGAAGKTLESVLTSGRAFMTPRVDANVAKRVATMRQADKVNYGKAAREGERTAAAGMGPVQNESQQVLRSALEREEVAPFAAMVKATKQFADADDATLLRETYKLMSRQQTGLARRLKEQGFDAKMQLEHDNLAAIKGELLDAADAVMPSFRKAVQSHAKARGGIEAVKLGRKGAQGSIGKTYGGAHPETQSPEALRERILKLPPEEQQAAIEGALGRLRETIGIQPNAVSLGGAMTTAIRPARVAPFLRSLNDPGQRRLDDIIKASILSGRVLVP